MATRYQRSIQKRQPKDIQHNGHKIPKGYSEDVNQRICNTMATRYQRGIKVLHILWFTSSEYPFVILWPLCCISFGWRFWILLWYLVAIVLHILRFTASDYPFGIMWPLRCISFGLRLLIVPLVSCDHCVVYPSAYGFWIPLWYLVAIVLYILRFTASDYPFGIFWPLCCSKGVFRSRKPKDMQHNGHKIPKGYSEAVNRRIYNTMATRYQRGNQKP
jgi:hypothetical protein